MQLSLELEYWTVDESGALAPATPVLDRLDDLDGEYADPMLEVVTDPCDDVASLRTEVADRLREAIRVARDENRRLVPLGTPLNAGSVETSEDPRSRIQRRVLGETFEHAASCAGTHLHVDRIDGAEADQLNLLTALDPAAALVASSRHHRGDVVAACARPHVYRRSCYGDHPRLGRLWPYVDDVDAWEDRIDATHRRFRERALVEGVDPAIFDEHFAPEDSTWAPVRLRDEYDTIEWRAPDAALPGQLLRLVEDVQTALGIAVREDVEIGGPAGVTESGVSLPGFDRLRRQVRTTVDRGLDAPGIMRYLNAMGLSPDRYHSVSAELRDAGRVTRGRARRLRLRYADRLEREVVALRAERPPAPALAT